MIKTPEMYDMWNDTMKMIEFCGEQNIAVECADMGKQSPDTGEFWRYREGMNIGNEISKDEFFKRPCLILKTNMGNGLVLIAPITSKYHPRLQKYYLPVRKFEKYGLKECWIILNQIKLVDKKRLHNITAVYRPNRSFAEYVKEAYKNLL